MAGEKAEVITTADPHTEEVGEAGYDDAELQGRGNHSPPGEASSRDMLEVASSKNGDEPDETD
jgi:hypothetical protein